MCNKKPQKSFFLLSSPCHLQCLQVDDRRVRVRHGADEGHSAGQGGRGTGGEVLLVGGALKMNSRINKKKIFIKNSLIIKGKPYRVPHVDVGVDQACGKTLFLENLKGKEKFACCQFSTWQPDDPAGGDAVDVGLERGADALLPLPKY